MNGSDFTFAGTHGTIVGRRWLPADGAPRFVALIAHGYGEHGRRYDHVAERLTDIGAAVYIPDHVGHGRSEGPRAKISLVESMSTDLHEVADLARQEYPGLPVVLVGHSMGGMVATRFAQRFGDELTALALSAPVIGGNPAFSALARMEPMPEVPIDPAVLSRDPEVGAAYEADPLVHHGALEREELLAVETIVATISEGGGFGALPVLWMHGTADELAPLDATRPVIEKLRGATLVERTYPEARHEIFNETNRAEVLDDLVAFLVGTLEA